MRRTLINEIKPEQEIIIKGWLERIRDSKYMYFLVVKDITGKIQVTIEKEKFPEICEVVKTATANSVVTVKGIAHLSEYVKMGGIELIPSEIIVDSVADALPIMDNANIDNRLDFRFIDLRQEKNVLMFQVQTCFVNALREFVNNKKFIEIHSPCLIGTESESGAGVFEVKYFDTKAFLRQSPQFYKQMAMASGFDGIYECGPIFRAEQSYTNRHATEFTGFDIEFSHIDSFEDVMSFEEDLLIHALSKVKEEYGEKIKEVFGVEVIVPKKPFPKMALADLYKEFEKYGYNEKPEERNDLTTEGEKLCYKIAKEKFGSEFMFVTDFPADKRAFYHMRKNGVLQGYDLIWKGVEVTTGAQREHRYEILKAQAKEKGLDKDVEFYLEFFKYGCPPHGGFGLGIDRLTMLLLDIPTIKEVQFLFRGPNRITP